MDLSTLLEAMDNTAANLAKLNRLWERAEEMIPTGPQRGSSPEYDDLRRQWKHLLGGLPKLDGWTVTALLPDIDEVGQLYIDLWELGDPTFDLAEANLEPGRQLSRYGWLLRKARREAIRKRVQALINSIKGALSVIIDETSPHFQDRVDNQSTAMVHESITEIERLLGDTVERRGRWADLHRHLSFSEGQDWHDIHAKDWPSVLDDIDAAIWPEEDPLPVADIDLAFEAANNPTGGVTTGFNWENLTPEEFERLLFDLFRRFPNHRNVQWLMHTRAPDRGRDLNADVEIRDDGGTIRNERKIIQAKHWTKRSVGPQDFHASIAPLRTWQPPHIHVFVIVTSGSFTADTVKLIEQHNAHGESPRIEMWPGSHLESLLTAHPDLIASYGVRA